MLSIVRIRVALAVCAAVVLGSSCTADEPSPSPLPAISSAPTTPTVAPTPAPTPTPSPPALPALARQDSPAGAEAFARYWLTTLDYATTTGDTRLLRQLANCAGCNALAESIDKVRAEGGRTLGGKATVSKSNTIRHVPAKAALVDLTYSRRTRIVDRPPDQRQTVGPERDVRLLITLRRNRSWLITDAQPIR